MNINDLKAASTEYERAKREEEKRIEAEKRAEEQRHAAAEAQRRAEEERKRYEAERKKQLAESRRRERLERLKYLLARYSPAVIFLGIGALVVYFAIAIVIPSIMGLAVKIIGGILLVAVTVILLEIGPIGWIILTIAYFIWNGGCL